MTLRIALLAAAAAVWAASAIPIIALAGAHDHGGDEGGSGTDGSPGSPAEVNRIVRVEALDQRFSVNQIQVRAGETIKFLITSKSSIPHEFVIASQGEHVEHRKMMQQMPDMKMDEETNAVTIEPGETKELIWRFGNDQDVEFACDIPGHAEQGMAGKFRVTK
jgi:uncharacterized cupredoxin-like copper-binding protein